MAGNRQQSRFLALLSNYDRYKELSEEAANAENASTLQFLKTLDSIEAKTQQLQTSLQALYVSSGLETFYKGILDITNSIAQSFTNMPTLFNLPIAAISKFGMTFYSLANVVKSVFAIIMNEIQIEKTKFNALKSGEVQVVKNAEAQKTAIVQSETAKRLEIIRKQVQEGKQLSDKDLRLFAENEAAKSNLLRNGGTESVGNIKLGGKEFGVSTLGLNIGALAANVIGSTLKSSNNQFVKGTGGLASIAGSALSGAAMGAAIPIPGAAVVGAGLGAIVGAFENFNTIFPSTVEQLKNLTSIAEEAKNKALSEQAEAKSLQSAIDKLKELEKVRYSSLEAEQAYLEASDALAQQHPELIKQYDATGKAIIDLSSAATLLQESLQKSADAVRDSAIANYNAQKKKNEANLTYGEEVAADQARGASSGAKREVLFSALNASENRATIAKANKISTSEDILSNITDSKIKNIVNSFLNEDLSQIFEPLKSSIAEAQNLDLDDFDRVLLDAINNRLQSITPALTKVIAQDNKLTKIAEAGATQHIQTLLQLEAYQDKFWDDIVDGNEIITSLLINNFQDYDGDYTKYMNELPASLEAAQEELKKAIEAIGGKENFNALTQMRSTISADKFREHLQKIYPNLESNLFEALMRSFEGLYNIEDFKLNIQNLDNGSIKAFLQSQSENLFSSLTGNQLQAINKQAEDYQKLISSGTLTNTQGFSLFKQYTDLWTQLDDENLSNETQTTGKNLLSAWDGTKEGLENLRQALLNSGLDESNKIFDTIGDLAKALSQNLNTLVQTLSSSLATSIKNFDSAITDLSKGVAIDKAVEYAQTLGLHLNDFILDYSTGLYKLDDTQLIYQNYFKGIDEQLEEVNTMLKQYAQNAGSIKSLIRLSDGAEFDETRKQLYEVLGKQGLDKREVDNIINEFRATNLGIEEFDTWLAQHYDDITNALNEARNNAKARAALSLGDLTGFLTTVLGEDTDEIFGEIIASFIEQGGFNYDAIVAIAGEEAAKKLQEYDEAIVTSAGDSAKNVIDKLLASVKQGTQAIKVTEGNKALLESLSKVVSITGDIVEGQEVIVNTAELKNNYAQVISKISSLAGLADETKAELIESIEKAAGGTQKVEAFKKVIESYEGFGADAALAFSEAIGVELSDIPIDSASGQFHLTLEQLKAYAAEQLDKNLITVKDYNAIRASIDEQARESSKLSIFQDIGKNYQSITESSLQSLADAVGGNYDNVTKFFKQNADGTYKTDLSHLQALRTALGVETNKAAQEIIDSVIDAYLNQLSSISKTQASGLTNFSDMRALANQFADGDLGIFQWDKELRAYTLSNKGVMRQARAAAEQLASLDKNSEEYKKAYQLMKTDGQALVDSIDFLGLVSAVGTDGYVDAVRTFNAAVADYNAYLQGTGENIQVSALALHKAAQAGGMEAVAAAKAIADQAGKKLTGSDVETIYRSRATQINTALSQVNLSVGSIIDDTTVKLLGIQGQVTDLGSGKYVINSAIDMVEAHKQLLREMYNDNTYTLEELNALQAKILAGDEQADLLSSLNNLTGLTYEALGNIAKSAGYSLFNFYEVLTKAGAVENLGGGKVRITNFDFFAEITGLLDKSSEEYISVLSKYNDEIISANRTRADGVVKELKAVGEAKAGDQINIANIWGSLNEELRDTLTINLETAGAEIKNGIISLGDASIAEVLQILHSTTDSIASVTERDKAIIEDAFETLLNNITEQIKQGLQGKLSNVGKVDLKEQLANTYGIELSDSDFIKTADGWQLAADAAFEVVDAMREIDSIQGDLVLKELRQSLKDANFEVTDLYSHATSLGYKNKSGNVDLIAHAKHQISGTRMQNAGWQDFSTEDYATLYSTTFTSDKFEKDVPILLNVTPITNDGKEILSPESLNNYVRDLFEKGNTASEILELDRQGKGLLLGAEDLESFEDIQEAVKKAETEMELLHEQSDRLASRWKEISEINLMEATSKNDSLNFMSNKLPDALENPLTYAENWGKAINILQNGSGDKKGFIDARDWYNIVNEMNHIAGMGQNIKMYGVELNGSLQSASELIQKGYNALKSIDGGKMQVDLSQLGVSFEQGALDMKGSVTDGIHAMAQSQIDMLDGLIAVLETVVAMEEAFKGLNIAEDGNLAFGELFKSFYNDMNFETGDFQATSQFKIAASRLTKTFEGMDDLKNPLKQIKINGQQLGQLYEDAKNGVVFSEDQAQALAAATNALYKASLSGNYDLDNIYESVKEVLQQSDVMDGSLSVDIGTSTIYLTGNVVTSIDWSAKNTRRALRNRYKGKNSADGQTPEEQAKELLHQWHNEPTKIITEGDEADLQFILETSPQIVTKYDKNGKPVSYEVAGHIFKDKNQAARALYLLEHGVEEGDIVVDDQGNSKGVIKGKEGTQIEIEYTTEGVKYTLTTDEGTFEGSSKEECLDKYIQAIEGIDEDSYNKKTTAQKETLRRQASATLQFDYTGTSFTPGKNFKPKMEHTNKFLEWFNNGDFSEQSVKDFIKNNEFDITIGSEIEGELTADQLKELASYFGVDASMEAKNLALNVTTTGLEGPLLNILTGQEATPIPVELKAKLVPSGEGEGLTAGEDGTFTLSGDVSITPTSVTLSSTEEGGIPLNQPVDTTAAALNVDASNAVSHVTGSPAEIDDKNHPIVNSTALSFIVDLTDKVNNPDWEGMGTTGSESNPIKYNQALYVATTIAGFKFNEGENSDGSPAGSKERLQAALVQVMNGLLTNGQLDFGQKVDMLIQLGKFLPVGGIKKPTKEDLQLPSGWFDSEGNLSIEMALKALYQVTFDKDPESETFTEPTNADLGVPETITLPPTTIVVPYKYQPLPTGASFGLDSDLTNNRAWNNGALDIDSYLLQGPEQEQASKLEQYVNDVLAYKNEGGIFSEETGQNINALTGWFSRFDETNIPEHLRPIAEALNQINAVESSNIESTTAAISALGESPALTNNATADTLDKLGQEALEMCGVDAGQLERFWHILDNLPDAANAFIGGADWEKVVTVFQQLAEITGSMTGNSDNSEEGESPLAKALGTLAGLTTTLDDNFIANLGSLRTAFSEFTNVSPENLHSCVSAMESLHTQATNLSTFNWSDLATKLRTLLNANLGGTGGEGGEGDEGGGNVLNLQVQLDMDAVASELLSNKTIERKVVVKAEGEGQKPTENTDTSGGTTSSDSESGGGDTSAANEGLSALEEAAESAAEPMNTLATSMESIPADKAQNVSTLATSINEIKDNSQPIVKEKEAIESIKDRSDRVNHLADAIDRIPDKKTISIDAIVNLDVNVDVHKTGGDSNKDTGGSKGNVDVSVDSSYKLKSSSHYTIAKAKGSNIALPKGNRKTLMGELGPELFVSNGRYHVAGENGAEFVDLPKDAIVFNHKLTKKLLNKGSIGGRGKPITNETNAISFATGNVSGPAMASAAAALAALKQLRAMWASMLNASAKDLGSQAGRGGGGGQKDDNGKYKQPTSTTADIQRWYNLIRQIDKIEQDITYQEKLQNKYQTDRIANGDKIYQSQKKQLELLSGEITRQKQLVKLQKSWYDNKRAELAASSYGKIFTYDENGLQQYVGTGAKGSKQGLDILENLTRRTVQGQPTGNAATSKAQLKYLKSVGFDLNELIWNDDGTKVVEKIASNLALTKIEDDETEDEDLYTKLMENFWDRVDGWRDELDSLYDSYNDTLTDIEENQIKQNEILQAFVDNELDVEQKLLKAVEAREQAVIDKLNEQKNALEKSTNKFVKGLKDQLDKEKAMQESNDEQESLTKLQRQLAILQRSGGSTSQIKSLQDQIASKQQDMYYTGRQNEIDTIQEAADKQIEKLDQQISILSETLEYQKQNGLFWNEIREMMTQPVEAITDFYNKWVTSASGDSILKQEEDLRDFKEKFQEWVGYRKDKEEQATMSSIIDTVANDEKYKAQNDKWLSSMTESEADEARSAAEAAAKTARENYLKSNPNDEAGANAAAAKAYNASLKSSYMSSSAKDADRSQFDTNYGKWLTNRRLSNKNDFTNQELFSKNESTFKDAMRNYYLEHVDDEGISEQALWQKSIEAGEKALNNRAASLVNTGTTTSAKLSKKAQAYKKNSKNKWVKQTTIAKGSVFTYDNAKEISINGKKTKMLHISGRNSKQYWVPTSAVEGGSSIYNKITQGKALKSSAGAIDALSNTIAGVGGNGYYASDAQRVFNVTGLTKKALGFTAKKLQDTSGNLLSPSAKKNQIEIDKVKGLTLDKKGKKVKSLSKVRVSKLKTQNGTMRTLKTKQWITSNATLVKRINAAIKKNGHIIDILSYMNGQYKEGGMADFTGPAWLDGTKKKPEAVLNAEQTSFLKNDLLGNQSNSLMSIVSALRDSIGGSAVGSSSVSSDDSVVFENVDVTFEAGTISNDYDMKRAGEMFKEELVKMARKAGSRSVAKR